MPSSSRRRSSPARSVAMAGRIARRGRRSKRALPDQRALLQMSPALFAAAPGSRLLLRWSMARSLAGGRLTMVVTEWQERGAGVCAAGVPPAWSVGIAARRRERPYTDGPAQALSAARDPAAGDRRGVRARARRLHQLGPARTPSRAAARLVERHPLSAPLAFMLIYAAAVALSIPGGRGSDHGRRLPVRGRGRHLLRGDRGDHRRDDRVPDRPDRARRQSAPEGGARECAAWRRAFARTP